MYKVILFGEINPGKTTLLSSLLNSDAKQESILKNE